MKWLNYIKFRTKLLLLIGTPTIGLLIILFGLLQVTSITVESIDNFSNIETRIALSINNLYGLGLQGAQATRNIILNSSDQTAMENYTSSKNEFKQEILQIYAIGKDKTELISLITEIESLFTEMNIANENVQQLVINGNFDESVSVLNSAVTPKWRILKANILKASKMHLKLMNTEKETMIKKLNDFSSTSNFGGIIIVIITLIIGTIGITTITRSIMEIKRAALKIAKGNTNFSLSVEGSDEISELQTAFNQMIDNINTTNNTLINEKTELEEVQHKIKAAIIESTNQKQYLEEKTSIILGAMQKFSQGDLTEKLDIEKNDEMGILFDGFNQTISNVRELIRQVSESILATASASTEISSNAEEMASGVQELSTQTSEVTSAINEMSKTIYDSAKNSSLAAENAKHSGTKAEEGGKVVKETINGMNKIAEVVKKSADTVNILGQNSEKIGEIISVISDIADQTNLLALNAAIEAARAGEQGRGFAVVADEVRKLAERTTTATKEITQMIKQIQESTQEAVVSMEEGTSQVENGKVLASHAGNVLDEIVLSSQKVTDIIIQVAAASEEQSSAAEEISKSIEGINNVTQESTMGIQQIAKASEDLSQLTNRLQNLISRFSISKDRSLLYKGSK
ncbi:MAG: methyl-accepting chemotaxis protein [bacterium]